VDEQDAVVCVRRSSCERVTLREELVGRLSFGSRFPQYLITAILTGAVVLARYISDMVREANWTLCGCKEEVEDFGFGSLVGVDFVVYAGSFAGFRDKIDCQLL
jgi:hypothetical protein